MRRRRFLESAGAFAASLALAPLPANGQGPPPRFADMHCHLGFPRGPASFRDAMAEGGMLVIAEKVVPDMLLLRNVGNRLASIREAKPGELRKNFEAGLALRARRVRDDGLAAVTSVELLDRVVAERTPAVVLCSEGADFLEGDLGYVEKIRAHGLVHLQLVHFYWTSAIGDIATEEPEHGGLTAFGKDVVRACNRLGILVDVAHCAARGMDDALEISSKPVIYSHGHVSARLPNPSRGGIAARGIYAPLAKRLAEKGGVIGLWPNRSVYANLDLYADAIERAVQAYGAAHIGIGTDMFGVPRSVVPSYREFARLAEYLAQRGLKDAEIDAVLGGNYLRVLRQALVV